MSHPEVQGYKDEASSQNQSSHPPQPHQRPAIHQAPATPQSFPSTHPPQHHTSFPQASSIPGSQHPHPQENIGYYHHPSAGYGTPGGPPQQYQGQGTEIMATAHHGMPRSYHNIYHTPQSNSPASVASPTGPDPRSVYSTPQMPQQIYGYPAQYGSMPPAPQTYPHPQQHGLTNQPLLLSQAPGQNISSPQPQQHPPHPPVTNPSPRTQKGGGSNSSSSGVNPNAAPGPIPATTPLVVRQDNNGVQWIAFEYSRDRVKMEYTIRCDVENVNVDNLSSDFKTENCVYPRACCPKEQYRGNRLQYETECNTVGWALAELNPCLRGKRGLIQRAVDSWRNSNQDPKLRSRRVRRMAKLNSRKANSTTQPHSQLGAGSSMNSAPSSGNGLGLKGDEEQENITGSMIHHHHPPATTNQYNPMPAMQSTAPSRSTSGHLSPAVGGAEEYPNGHHHQAPTSNGEMRPRQIFHAYPPAYPPQEAVPGASMAPTMHEPINNLGQSSNATAVTTAAPVADGSSSSSLFGVLPDNKRRKFILVDDPHRGNRVRVRVMLDQVQMQEIPDSYRKSNSVYPRSYISQIEDAPDSNNTTHQSEITVPLLDGSHMNISAPPPSHRKRTKERQLNELGYRMSWSQSRVFAGRTIFLQRARK